MNFKEEMEKRGATPAQLDSKASKIMMDIIAENNGEIPEGATGRADEIEKQLKNAHREAWNTIQAVDSLKSNLNSEISKGNTVLIALSGALEEADAYIVKDKVDQEALNVFKNCLSIVADQFNDKLTESIICKAIEAGSYMAWRSIMGPKYGNYGKN